MTTSSYTGNGVYVVQGEISALITSMKKVHWSARSYQEDENNPLLKGLAELKVTLNHISTLQDIKLKTFLDPFLDVIRSKETSVQVTVLALSSINKFISYGLIGSNTEKYLLPEIDDIADVVAHPNFVTTDHSSDMAVLMKMVEVLRTLVLSPLGRQLSHDSMCESMLNCFKICFETRLNEFLRQSAEKCLKDIVQLLFNRLPEFAETMSDVNMGHYKKMRIRSKSVDYQKKKKNKQNIRNTTKSSDVKQIKGKKAFNKEEYSDPNAAASKTDTSLMESAESEVRDHNTESACVSPSGDLASPESEYISVTSNENIEDSNECKIINNTVDQSPESTQNSAVDPSLDPAKTSLENINTISEIVDRKSDEEIKQNESSQAPSPTNEYVEGINNRQYINSQGVRFMSDDPNLEDWLIAERIPIQVEPHNIICVQELLQFLALICDPHEKENTDVRIYISLSLLTIALEVGAEHIAKHPSFLAIIKDTLCRNLLSLINTKNMQIFTASLHVCFLLFESMRVHLKFQLEYYLCRLSELIIADTPQVSFDKKEMALESMVQLWRIPGLVTELFLNYDCDLYGPNLYEEISKLLSKNVYPVSGIYSTHLIALDALLTIVESIEKHCHSRISNDRVTNEQNLDHISEVKSNEKQTVSVSVNMNEEISFNAPSHEELMAIKRKKKLLATGTEHYNANPKKGIQYLQEQGILSDPLEPMEVATFLRENPHLDKKVIGEFISHRSNMLVLEQFVNTFDFTDMRIDDALRLYLETFRLPGESPLISLVLQQFALHWLKCNNEPASRADAIFILAYAIIMLNTDQHNPNVSRHHAPMTVDDFKKNLRGQDCGSDFDQDLLDEIYQSIKNEEIVLPDERTGRVRENYLWKVLLRRGTSKDGTYIRARDGFYDHQLFSLCWVPVVTALSYVFDKATDSSVYLRSVQGFRKCATISAYYGMSNEFDNLILTLCKFTMLLNPSENPESFTISFGMNSKARLATRTVFCMVHRHGDILREGWRNIFDCIFQLFRCKLLPKILVEAEDFLDLSGKVSLIREDVSSHKSTETGILSSFYSYFAPTDASSQRINTEEEQECIEVAATCISECQLENLISESKFLRLESLHELLKVLIKACYNADGVIVLNTKLEEDKAIFFLEILLKVVVQNRDRVSTLWQMVCDHLYLLLMAAAAAEQQFLIERCVIGLLKLGIRLMNREEVSSLILQSLQMLLLLKWSILSSVNRQISYGLHVLLKTAAANIHSENDWAVIFTLLEVVGAGAPLPKISPNFGIHVAGSNDCKSSEDTNTEAATEDSGLGYDKQYFSSSDSSLNHLTSSNAPSPTESYLFLNGCEDDVGSGSSTKPFYSCNDLLPHDPFSLVKCCESLAFLVRDVAHITPFNFESCVHCIRTFVEATLYTGDRKTGKKKSGSVNGKTRSKDKGTAKKKASSLKSNSNPYDADESDPEEFPDSYFQVPLQLLDLMHTLHTRTAQIHKCWAEEHSETEVKSLWPHGWCPLLQGIARLCCDPRKADRMSAITYLQRALLMHDLQTLSANEWESCFNNVLFPLLDKLSEPFQGKDVAGVEETRMRAATLLSKVFLHHLSPLQLLPSFTTLWLRILDFMDLYMNIDKNSDMLNEAIQESVKNMILVMESAKLFSAENGENPFWKSTWERVDKFLPNLRNELFRHQTTAGHESGDAMAKQIADAKEQILMSKSSHDENAAELKQSDTSLKHSIPIFPHMGQLISTPIGPPPAAFNKPQLDEDAYKENADHTRISSLIASTPDFLSTLPSFRPQSPPQLNHPLINRSFAESPPPEHLDPYLKQVYCDSISTVSLPNVQSHQLINAVELSHIKRTSSVCDNSDHVRYVPQSTVPPFMPFEVNSTTTAGVQPVEPSLTPHFPVQDDFNAAKFTEPSIVGSEADARVQSISSPTSAKSNLPVYSGFAQLDMAASVEENNAKQFFY